MMSEEKTVHTMIIIGSGPAGHTAAIYAARAMMEPLMFEGWMAGGVAPGGQLTTTTEIENFPGFPTGIGGTELMTRMREQSINAGATIRTETVDRVVLSDDPATTPHQVYVGETQYQTRTVIVATGATAKKLDVPGVDQFRNKGISGCAVCDGALPVFRDKPLVVIGGGDVAMEEAMHLTKYGSHVHVLVRRDQLKASKVMGDRAMAHDKITFHRHTELVSAHGDDLLTHLTIVNNQTNQQTTLDAGGLFFAIGHTPNTAFLDGQVELDDAHYIVTTPGTTKTTVPGVYAAGDVQDKVWRQAITSAGTGCMAALEAEKFIHEMAE